MTIDKQKLKALAEAATQSHGARRVEVDHNGVHVIGDGSWKILSAWHTPDGKGSQNAEFAAAASPATVLALLAEIERLESEAMYMAAGFQSDREQVCQLRAENEAMRKDAENWQTVQRAMEQLKSDEQGAAIWSACSRILISLASDMNSASSVVTEEGVTKDGAEIGDWRVTVERLAMAKEASHD